MVHGETWPHRIAKPEMRRDIHPMDRFPFPQKLLDLQSWQAICVKSRLRKSRIETPSRPPPYRRYTRLHTEGHAKKATAAILFQKMDYLNLNDMLVFVLILTCPVNI